MQKKLIALAIASAMTVPALAYAEVNISGQANMSVDMLNDGAVTNSASANYLNSNQSRLVIKGSEDLGDGLSAMYQLDSRFNLDNGSISANGTSATLLGGNNFIGLKSNDMGTLMVGKIDSPYKSAFRGLDVFFDVAGDNRSGVGGIGGLFTTDVRLNNALAYMSPNFSGFSVSAASVFGAEATVNSPTPNKKGQALALSAMYKMDNIYAAAAYQNVKLGDPNTGDLGATTTAAACIPASTSCTDDEAKSWKIGGGYTMDAFTVNAEIEGTTDTPSLAGSVSETGTNLYIAGKFAVSDSDSVRVAYTKLGETKDTGAANQNGSNQFALGYSHNMSKATSVYASYVKETADVNHNLGADPSVISVGMKHAF
jgi:predicted porin